MKGTRGWLVVMLLGWLLCGPWPADAQSLSAGLDQSLDATCRVRCGDGSTGTGCVFAIADGQVWVLTAAHVVDSATQVTCEFWRAGHQSRPLAAVVAGRSAGYDVATVVLSEAQFEGLLPEVVPLAPPEFVVRPGQTLTSAGCARGAWATALKGHARGYSGTDLYFVPPPANGRSGSALMDAEGRYIVGVVRARTGDDSTGIASSIQAVYAAFGTPQQRSSAYAALRIVPPGRLVPVAGTSVDLLAQCPGGVCPGASDQSRWYLLPYRYRQQFRTQPAPSPSPSPAPDGGGAWPTLPPPLTAPQIDVAPVVPDVTIDLSPLAQPLQGLADAQKGLSDAVGAYLEAQGRRQAEAEAERKIGAVAPDIAQAGSAALSGQWEGAADTLGHSSSLWSLLGELAWTVLAPLLGVGAVGFGFGKVIIRAIARALGPTGYDAAKSAIVDWWKDDNDTPDEAKAKQRMAEAAADATVKKLNGGAAAVANGGAAK